MNKFKDNSPPKTTRAFFAIEIPKSLQKEISKITIELKKNQLYREIKWTKLKNLHITLRFLGQISDEQLDAISRDIVAELNDLKPFKIQLAELVPFPQADFPIALVLKPTPVEALRELALRIDTIAIKHGAPIEKRGFNPHLTLARVKHKLPEKNLNKYLPLKFPPLTIEINEIKLMRSEPTPRGSHYSEIHSVALHA